MFKTRQMSHLMRSHGLGSTVVTVLALMALSVAGSAYDHHSDKNTKVKKMQAHMVERVDDMFKRHDHNNDGVITHAEMMKQTKDRFEKIDKNKDGFIILDEMPKDPKALKELLGHGGKMKMRHHQGKDKKKRAGDKDHKKRPHKMRAHKMNRIAVMHRMDRNKDEMISLDEFSTPAVRRFKRGDRNGDGSITREEVKEMLKVRVKRMHKKKHMKKVRERIEVKR